MGVNKQFSLYWDTVVKPAIVKHLNSGGVVTDAVREMSSEDFVMFFKKKKFKDGIAPYYLSQLVWRVEHDLADDRLGGCLSTLDGCCATLKSKSYWLNVWENKYSSDEAKRLKEIGVMLEKFINLIDVK